MAKHPRSLVPTVGAAPAIEVALPRPRPAPPRRRRRVLHTERWLAAPPLTPAVGPLAPLLASMLLPFIVPPVLSTFAWPWMVDPTFSVVNWLLYRVGLITNKLPFLSDGRWAMWCAIGVNAWRGMPFFAITLLAGLQTIN